MKSQRYTERANHVTFYHYETKTCEQHWKISTHFRCYASFHHFLNAFPLMAVDTSQLVSFELITLRATVVKGGGALMRKL
ncbi:MAG: hypothetical protein KGO81_11075 [Bacteroidota bacterium]|nr:hypothetical protein [Bacteroidota bacterium]